MFTYPYLMTILSPITAPAATNPPDSTFACLTVEPIDTNAQSPNSDPWSMALGPTNTSLPILTCCDKWARSWTTQLSPILIPLVPIKVAPYQIEELLPTYTFPRIVALGATNSAPSRLGSELPYPSFLKLGTRRSSDAFSPYNWVPAA